MMSHTPPAEDAWSPEVRARLDALLAGPAGTAVFDWDDTVLQGDVGIALLDTHDATHGTRWHARYDALLEEGGRAAAYPALTAFFAGYTPQRLHDFCETVVARTLDGDLARFRPRMKELITELHEAGWEVWVVTASPAALVRVMAGRLGIPTHRVIGMDLHVDADGRYTAEVRQPATFCEGKLAAIDVHIGRRPELCAGDSRSDAWMLDAAGTALLIDGHDAELREEARRKGWAIQSGWTHSPPEPGVVAAPPPRR